MHPAEEFVKEFKEGQDHMYDKGYWAGKIHPNLLHNENKGLKIMSWVGLIIWAPLIVLQIIAGIIYLFS